MGPPAPPPVPAAAIVTLAPGADASALGRRAAPLWSGSREYLVRLPRGATPAALRRLRSLPGVTRVEPDRVRRPLGTAGGDPLRPRQHHLAQIRWSPPPAGRRGPVVAVLDTGVDRRAPDLAPALLVEQARSFVPGSRNPFSDREGHGTHVAGILAAVTGNGEGGSGVAAVDVLPVKIADVTGNASTSSLVRGIRYAVARGAKVINISFGGPGHSAIEQEAINDAVRRGVLVVAASGNSGAAGSPREYPGAYRHVLTVAATGGNRALPISTRGPQVAVAAPGDDIVSTAPPPENYTIRSGTSMATAMVSGLAARLLTRTPGLDPSQLREMIRSSARDLPPRGRDDATGAGLIDMRAALAYPAPPPDTPEPNDEPREAARTPPLLAGTSAAATRPASATVEGRVEGWSDPGDGYRVSLRRGQRLVATLRGPRGVDLDLLLWRPGTPALRRGPAFARRWLAASALGPSSNERLRLTAPADGVYTLEVRAVSGGGRYRLTARR